MSTGEKEIIRIMPVRLRKEMEEMEQLSGIQEIRIRIGKHVHIITGKEDIQVHFKKTESIISQEDMREITEYISGYSMYAYENELRNGFLTLKGGHRVGIVGEAVLEGGKIKTIKNISSFNIRISRQIKGCADALMKYAEKSILMISPPRVGKTTLLRDLLRQIAERPMESVGIVDERSEIAACYHGRPENDLGERVDVLDNCPKAEGMMLLLRSMSPTVIGVDELGRKEDVEAVLSVINSGIRVIATIHGDALSDIQKKPVFRELFCNQVFSYCFVLQKEDILVYDRDNQLVERVRRC